jgi:hypothetical protein
VKLKGVKKHPGGLVDASVRNDDRAYGCMQCCILKQRFLSFSQIMLFFTTAAHFTWLLHVHLHIITSFALVPTFANIIADISSSSFYPGKSS